MGRDGEDSLVAWLRQRPETGELIGDDTAILPAGGPWSVTVDAQRAGVHFPEWLDEADVARRLLQVNLSDLAAAGARPRYGFLALALAPESDARRFLRAMLDACRQHDLILAGGDLSRSPMLGATLTLIGDRWPHGRFLSRTSATPGDRLWLAGDLGLSALGRELLARVDGERLPRSLPTGLGPTARRAMARHLRPSARLDVGRWLARRRSAVAAIDVSDGLALDLRRLCRASGVGCLVDETALTPAREVHRLARWLEVDALELVLGGGEDYALLFTLPTTLEPPRELGARVIGETVPGGRLWLDGPEGRRELPRLGWDHLERRR